MSRKLDDLPEAWTNVAHREYRSGVTNWTIYPEFARRMLGTTELSWRERDKMLREYVTMADTDIVWLMHRRHPGTSKFDLMVRPKARRHRMVKSK